MSRNLGYETQPAGVEPIPLISGSPMVLFVWLLIYCLAIAGVSLVGGWIPLLVRLTHRRMQVAISFVSGVMLGVGLMHLMPHALYEAERARGSIYNAAPEVFSWLVAGVLTMFFIERFFCFHHHDAPGPEIERNAPHDIGHDGHDHAHRLSWSGAAVGLTLHSMIDGVALAAAAKAESAGGQFIPFVGLSTFLVIFLHKPFDSLTLGTLMAAGGRSVRGRHVLNGLFAAAVPAGAGLFFLGAAGAVDHGGMYLAAALAFSAGTFLCISMSDLLPELQFHQHDRAMLSAALLLGLGAAWGVSVMEGKFHLHSRPREPAAATSAETTR